MSNARDKTWLVHKSPTHQMRRCHSSNAFKGSPIFDRILFYESHQQNSTATTLLPKPPETYRSKKVSSVAHSQSRPFSGGSLIGHHSTTHITRESESLITTHGVSIETSQSNYTIASKSKCTNNGYFTQHNNFSYTGTPCENLQECSNKLQIPRTKVRLKSYPQERYSNSCNQWQNTSTFTHSPVIKSKQYRHSQRECESKPDSHHCTAIHPNNPGSFPKFHFAKPPQTTLFGDDTETSALDCNINELHPAIDSPKSITTDSSSSTFNDFALRFQSPPNRTDTPSEASILSRSTSPGCYSDVASKEDFEGSCLLHDSHSEPENLHYRLAGSDNESQKSTATINLAPGNAKELSTDANSCSRKIHVIKTSTSLPDFLQTETPTHRLDEWLSYVMKIQEQTPRGSQWAFPDDYDVNTPINEKTPIGERILPRCTSPNVRDNLTADDNVSIICNNSNIGIKSAQSTDIDVDRHTDLKRSTLSPSAHPEHLESCHKLCSSTSPEIHPQTVFYTGGGHSHEGTFSSSLTQSSFGMEQSTATQLSFRQTPPNKDTSMSDSILNTEKIPERRKPVSQYPPSPPIAICVTEDTSPVKQTQVGSYYASRNGAQDSYKLQQTLLPVDGRQRGARHSHDRNSHMNTVQSHPHINTNTRIPLDDSTRVQGPFRLPLSPRSSIGSITSMHSTRSSNADSAVDLCPPDDDQDLEPETEAHMNGLLDARSFPSKECKCQHYSDITSTGRRLSPSQKRPMDRTLQREQRNDNTAFMDSMFESWSKSRSSVLGYTTSSQHVRKVNTDMTERLGSISGQSPENIPNSKFSIPNSNFSIPKSNISTGTSDISSKDIGLFNSTSTVSHRDEFSDIRLKSTTSSLLAGDSKTRPPFISTIHPSGILYSDNIEPEPNTEDNQNWKRESSEETHHSSVSESRIELNVTHDGNELKHIVDKDPVHRVPSSIPYLIVSDHSETIQGDRIYNAETYSFEDRTTATSEDNLSTLTSSLGMSLSMTPQSSSTMLLESTTSSQGLDLLDVHFNRNRSGSISSISSGGSTCSTCTYSSDSDTESRTPRPRKQSSWRKIRSFILWSPFIQVFKKHRYPWIQLAGHQGNFQAGDAGSVLKKLDPRERLCFQKVMTDSLKDYVPEYRGDVEKSGDSFIQLQDLLCSFTQPSVMDIKMGVRTYLEDELHKARKSPTLRKDMYQKMVEIDNNAPTAEEHQQKAVTKPRYMQWRDEMSSSVELGFRVEGIKKGDGNSSKDFKKTKSRKSVVDVIRSYVGDNPNIVTKYIRRLKEIMHTQESSPFFKSHEVIGSSLLFVHDVDENVSIWMIDFGKTDPLPESVSIDHRTPWQEGNHEDGYLFGLDNVLSVLEEIETSFSSSSV